MVALSATAAGAARALLGAGAFGAGARGACFCPPTGSGERAVGWVHKTFHDCVYDTSDVAGFMFWVASTSCWLVVLFPQLIENYRRKTSEALSFAFLLEWFMGDLSNLLGAVFSGDQLPTETYTAAYFILQDIIIISQHTYYTLFYKVAISGDEDSEDDDYSDDSSDTCSEAFDALEAGPGVTSAGGAGQHGAGGRLGQRGAAGGRNDARWAKGGWSGAAAGAVTAVACVVCVAAGMTVWATPGGWAGGGGGVGSPMRVLQDAGDVLLGVTSPPPGPRECLAPAPRSPGVKMLGTVLGYVSAIMYLFSRCSQIIKNHRRKSAEGLSGLLFSFAIGGNVTYGLSILLRATGWDDVLSKMPWLLGSLGTVCLDLTILGQAMTYSRKEAQQEVRSVEAGTSDGGARAPERVPLLSPA